jgi:hypothetical protein
LYSSSHHHIGDNLQHSGHTVTCRTIIVFQGSAAMFLY